MTSDTFSPEAIKKIEELNSWYFSKIAARERKEILPGLQHRLKNEAEPELRMILYTMIIGEHTRIEDLDAVISTAKCLANEFPDEPLSWITLANAYSHHSIISSLALDAIDKAIEVARRSGTFRRQSLQTKARILRYTQPTSQSEIPSDQSRGNCR